jgi:ATPase subunit of ABC transporter with duplicated ATPase domains
VFGRNLKHYLEKRDEELRAEAQRRDAEAQRRDAESRKRDAESRKRDEEGQKRDAEGRARWAEIKELRAKSDARAEETREFNREILLRNEKVYTSLIAQVEENTEQIRANTRAVLSVLDRLNGSSA